MAVDTGGTYYYRGNLLREDLADFIAQIGYKRKPTSDILGDTVAHQDRHEWNERALATRSNVARQQGLTYTFTEAQQATRRINFTQIIGFDVFVTRTAARSSNAGAEDLVADVTKLQTINLLNSINFSLVQSTLVTGATNAAQRMRGILDVGFQLSRIFTGSSGVTFSSTDVNDMQDNLESNGLTCTDVFVNTVDKRRLSLQTTSNTKYIMAEDKQVIESVGVYEGDFGVSVIHVERDLPLGTSGAGWGLTTGYGVAVGVDRSMLRKAWLDKPFMKMIPEREDGSAAVVMTELSFEFGSTSAIYVRDKTRS